MSFDPDTLDGLLELDGPGRLTVREAIARAPQLRLDTAGASTLIVVCDDPDHEIPGEIYSQTSRSLEMTATVAGRGWGLAAVKRSGGRTVLVFEDDVVLGLRSSATLSVPAGSTTVNELATRLARLPGSGRFVDVTLEPTRQTITEAFMLDGSVWAGLGDLAARTGRWRYSDGQQLVLASPSWLLDQPVAADVVEDEQGYGQIDYDLHSNKPLATAVASHAGNPPTVGAVHQLDLTGPAGGAWIVAGYAGNLGEDTGRTTWVRPTTWPPIRRAG